MRTKFPLLILLASALSWGTARAQSNMSIFINPGLKLGYTFGSKGGFTFGVELSVTTLPPRASYFLGGTVGVDYTPSAHLTKAHLGVEAGGLGAGIDVGPSWVTRGDRTDVGVTISPFLGLIFYPYYSATLMLHGDNIHEAGVWGKWPIPLVSHLNIFD